MILYITNAYPSKTNADRGIFNKEQIESVKKIKGDHFVNVISIDPPRINYVIVFFKILFLKKKNISVIHFHHGLTYVFFRVLFLRRKVFCSLQNELKFEFESNSKILSNFLLKLLKVISSCYSDIFIFKGKAEEIGLKSYSLPNGVNLDFFNKTSKNKAKLRQNLDLDSKYLLFVSSKNLNRKQKRFDLFKKLFDDSEIRNVYKPLIASNLNRSELKDYINSSEIVIVTSDFEGSSNLIKEAIACSAQIVMTKVGDYYRYINFRNISFCEKGNYDSILNKVKSHKAFFYDGHSLINKLSLSQNQVAKNLIKIYGI